MNYDVAIAGCGPSGAFCAKLLAEKGFKVVVFEEHDKIGLPKHCSGLIHPRIEDITGISFEEAIENEIRGAHIRFKDEELFLHAESCKSLVLERSIVDKIIAEEAEAAGADIKLGEKANRFERKSDGISVNGITCRLLIGADGIRSEVAKSFGLKEKGGMIRGMQCNARYKPEEKENVEVYFGRDVAPGFFAWVIPIAEDRCRIGLGVNEGSASTYLKKLLEKLDAEPYEIFGGGIPIGLRRKSYADRVMLVGDAAMQVKPISGGGVNISLKCAKMCAEVASKALDKDTMDEKSLSEYHKLWRKEFEREIRFGIMARRFIYSLNERELRRIFNAPDEELLNKISMYGDIDYPSRIAEPLMANVLAEPQRYINSRYLSLATLIPQGIRAILG